VYTPYQLCVVMYAYAYEPRCNKSNCSKHHTKLKLRRIEGCDAEPLGMGYVGIPAHRGSIRAVGCPGGAGGRMLDAAQPPRLRVLYIHTYIHMLT
jgi:hypothetical protein